MVEPLSNYKPRQVLEVIGGTFTGGARITNNTGMVRLALCNAGDYPTNERPDLALMAMQVIGAWSILDSHIARLVPVMLGGSEEAGVAMYQSTNTLNVQHTMLKAVAKSVLPDWQSALLNIFLDECRKLAKLRNKIAHHLWGYSADVPDGILLMDPKDYAECMSTNGNKLDYKKIHVFKVEDFRESILKIEHYSSLAHGIYFALGPCRDDPYLHLKPFLDETRIVSNMAKQHFDLRKNINSLRLPD